MRVFQPGKLGGGVRIRALGVELPARVVTNADLVAMGGPMTEEEILRLSGIRQRRWADPADATSDLAARAATRALARAGRTATDVDRLVLATVSPDHPSPSTASFVHAALGLGQVPAYDVVATCSGFVFALDQAARAVATGDACVVAVAADLRSRFLDVMDRATFALFGDGAVGAVVEPAPVGTGLLAVGTLSDGSGARSVMVPAGGSRLPASAATVAARQHTIRMEDGPQVYMQAVEGMVGTADALLQELGMTMEQVDLVVPHQPNRRLLDRMARLARVPPDKIVINVDTLGNMSAASCGVALAQALEDGRARAGMRVLLVAAGAGYTAGAALLLVDQALVDACRPEAA